MSPAVSDGGAVPGRDALDGSGVLDGRVALITGGSRGLGRAMAEGFARAGASLVIASRKLDACEQAAAELADRYGTESLAIATNVSDWDDCDRLVEAAYERFGRVDVLVNNAGMSPLYPSLPEVGEALFDKVIGVNLKGPFRLGSAIGAHMAESGGGSIINISSVEAARPEASALPYAAAKAGLEALTVGLAHAFGPTVRVNTIRCGMFRTDIAAAWGDPAAVDEMVGDRTDLGRIGEPDDVVGAALYFAGDASAYTTGATLQIDGGIL